MSSDDDDNFETCKRLLVTLLTLLYSKIKVQLDSLYIKVLQRVKTPAAKPKRTSESGSEDRYVSFVSLKTHDHHVKLFHSNPFPCQS